MEIETMKVWIRPLPRWKRIAKVNLTLHDRMKKYETAESEMKAMALAHIWEQGEDQMAIYTDGSRSKDGKIGSGVYIEKTNTKDSYLITDNQSINTAEMIAIRKALEWAKLTKTNRNVYSDALNVLQSIKSVYCNHQHYAEPDRGCEEGEEEIGTSRNHSRVSLDSKPRWNSREREGRRTGKSSIESRNDRHNSGNGAVVHGQSRQQEDKRHLGKEME